MQQTIQHGSSAPAFSASDWLARWSDHGGVAFVAGDHLYLSRLRPIDRAGHDSLDAIRAEIICDRARGEALAAYLVARSFGEALS